jgi:hypothetical protein
LIKPCCLPGKTSLRQPIKEQCLQQEPDLLPRFVAHYQQLKALRRRVRRSLQRQWKRSLAGVALLLALGQAPALAATINVSGTCTLVRAINAANNNTTASGNCRKGSGADTIVLPRGSTIRLTKVNNEVSYALPDGTEYTSANGLAVIRSDIIIAGKGSTIRRTASAPDFRIFAVGNTGDLTLRRTTVSGGKGGAVDIYQCSSVSLTNSTISGNSGSVFFGAYCGSLTAANSTISNNGSGIDLYGSVDLTNSTVSNNRNFAYISQA